MIDTHTHLNDKVYSECQNQVLLDAKANGSCDLCGLPAVADCTCTLEEEYTTEDSSFNHKFSV